MNLNEKTKINLLVTLNENYIPYLNTMLFSLIQKNSDCSFDIYLIHSSIRETSLLDTRKILNGHGKLITIQADSKMFQDAPTTDRYPKEIYYRIFAAHYLPEALDKVLYLDPDIIINGSIKQLYEIPMEDYYYAAASHVRSLIRKFNEIRLDMDENSPYINSGVILMNLKLLRCEQDIDEVFQYIEKYKKQLMLPDQDIISSLYGTKILTLNPFLYNMTERLYQLYLPIKKDLSLDWIRKNSIIIHYCGRNKPGKDNYFGKLDVFYNEILEKMKIF